MEDKYIQYAKIFKAFCDDNRLKVLEMLTTGEKCACVLLEKLQISQPTLSHHMKILVDSGIVAARKEHKWTHYSLSEQGTEQAKVIFTQFITLDETAINTVDNDCV